MGWSIILVKEFQLGARDTSQHGAFHEGFRYCSKLPGKNVLLNAAYASWNGAALAVTCFMCEVGDKVTMLPDEEPAAILSCLHTYPAFLG